MDGLVDQRAAALGLKAAPPAAFGVVGGLPVPGDKGPGPQHLSRLSGGQHLPEQLHAGVVAVLEADPHPDGRLLQSLEPGPLLPVDHRGLFGEHVDAPPGGLLGHGGVQVVGGADVQALELFSLQHRLQGGIGPPAELSGKGLGPLRPDVGTGEKLYPLQGGEGLPVDLGNAAAAHQAYAVFLHVTAPPLPGGCPPRSPLRSPVPVSRRISHPGRTGASGRPAPGRQGP